MSDLEITDIIGIILLVLFVLIVFWSDARGLDPGDVIGTIFFVILDGIVNFFKFLFKFIFSFKGFVSICLVTIVILLIAIKKNR